ncbi:uncharacterized protein MYCFIDRAFT_173892 [Pseudocercospora fijiensis CIRAD86]|uniref:Uncharacterized protein n=1 Tax=Pseudocercospora fijiensis (strain CIRAD86) TaxID=383855 RepID=M2Z5C6_PSEFD|nr:uncharacterized protein MYCFIDRAFT_173892 [Pseudocercospora fijiensis CIRAD86]EME85020.1 hypothetical protein MYCFIDRAFT_173892 [Pseudocercospora fijiensis CIRAD86]
MPLWIQNAPCRSLNVTSHPRQDEIMKAHALHIRPPASAGIQSDKACSGKESMLWTSFYLASRSSLNSPIRNHSSPTDSCKLLSSLEPSAMALVHVKNFSFCHCIYCHNTLAILEHPKFTQPCPISIWTTSHLYLTACVSCCLSNKAARYVHGMLVEASPHTKLLQDLSKSSNSAVQVWRRGTEIICSDYRFIVAKLGTWDELNWAFEPAPTMSMWQFLPIRSYRYIRPDDDLSSFNVDTETEHCQDLERSKSHHQDICTTTDSTGEMRFAEEMQSFGASSNWCWSERLDSPSQQRTCSMDELRRPSLAEKKSATRKKDLATVAHQFYSFPESCPCICFRSRVIASGALTVMVDVMVDVICIVEVVLSSLLASSEGEFFSRQTTEEPLWCGSGHEKLYKSQAGAFREDGMAPPMKPDFKTMRMKRAVAKLQASENLWWLVNDSLRNFVMGQMLTLLLMQLSQQKQKRLAASIWRLSGKYPPNCPQFDGSSTESMSLCDYFLPAHSLWRAKTTESSIFQTGHISHQRTVKEIGLQNSPYPERWNETSSGEHRDQPQDDDLG